ncbi:MAG: WcbI family polysaccharide biosynthesis putative acetyltransferase, partial [Ramlibacter sp.]
PEPGYPWKRYPHGDAIGLQIAQAGLSGPLSLAAYLDLSLREMPDLLERLQRDTDRMRHYDVHCDVKLADFVLENFRKQHLFWTYCHPSQACIQELALRVAAAARPVLGGTQARAQECISAMPAFGGVGGLQVPIHPVVADTLGLQFCQPGQTYLWYSQTWTFNDYIQRYIGYAKW